MQYLSKKSQIFGETCGLVLASRLTKFYKILISSLRVMPQKQNSCELSAARATKKLFYFLAFLAA
jgi:hypothetical protein